MRPRCRKAVPFTPEAFGTIGSKLAVGVVTVTRPGVRLVRTALVADEPTEPSLRSVTVSSPFAPGARIPSPAMAEDSCIKNGAWTASSMDDSDTGRWMAGPEMPRSGRARPAPSSAVAGI